MDLKCEGIVLQLLKFGDYDQILTLFTPSEGIVKMIVKGAYRQKKQNTQMAFVLMQGEFIFTRRNSSLAVCREVSIINTHLKLRENFTTLDSACAMARLLIASQMEQKPAPKLYELLIYYLKYLPSCKQPATLSTSFLLKLMRHEGFFGMTPNCSICKCELIDYYICSGESFCAKDSPQGSVMLSPFEAEALFTLACSRSITEIEQITLGEDLQGKIEWIFNSANHL